MGWEHTRHTRGEHAPHIDGSWWISIRFLRNRFSASDMSLLQSLPHTAHAPHIDGSKGLSCVGIELRGDWVPLSPRDLWKNFRRVNLGVWLSDLNPSHLRKNTCVYGCVRVFFLHKNCTPPHSVCTRVCTCVFVRVWKSLEIYFI